MAHSAKTAERAYVRTNLTRLGSQALNIIERVTAEKDDNGDQNEEAATTSKSPSVEKGATAQEDDNDNVSEPLESTEMTAAPRCTVSVVSEVAVPPTPGRGLTQDERAAILKAFDNVSEPAESTEMTAASSCTVSLVSEVIVPPTPGRGLTEGQKAATLKAFDKEITAGTKVSKALAQNRCGTTAALSVLSPSMAKVKQVVNHVNYIIEKKGGTLTPQSDEQTSPSKVTSWLHNYDDRSTRSSGKRQEWDGDDTKAIETTFKQHSSLPSTTEIKKILKQDTKLYFILEREGWSRVYTKVKNIFKKKSKH